jgi:DNA-binding GntR family transcriptional regulator
MLSARGLGMSQTPVREAIGLLESEGLVEQVPGQGTFVCVPTRKDFASLWDIRIMLESYSAKRAARRLRPRQLAELERLFARMRALARAIRDSGLDAIQGPLAQELALTDAHFHLTILRAADSPRLLRVTDNLQILSRLLTYSVPAQESVARQMAIQVREHRLIVRAMRRRDPKAARAAMRAHLRATRRIVLSVLRSRDFDDGGENPPPYFACVGT